MRKMQTICILAVLIICALPCVAMAEPVDWSNVVIDEDTPYSMVIDEINAEETESDGILETDEDTASYRAAVLENLDYLVELNKICMCVIIAAFVFLLIAIFSTRWIF